MKSTVQTLCFVSCTLFVSLGAIVQCAPKQTYRMPLEK